MIREGERERDRALLRLRLSSSPLSLLSEPGIWKEITFLSVNYGKTMKEKRETHKKKEGSPEWCRINSLTTSH